MSWITVRMEPEQPGAAAPRVALPDLVLCLPLLPDGRLLPHLLTDAPERARVWSRDRTGSDYRGHLRMIDFRWTCVWDEAGPGEPLPPVRLMGARFALDDRVGVRPSNGALVVYRVIAHCTELAPPSGWS